MSNYSLLKVFFILCCIFLINAVNGQTFSWTQIQKLSAKDRSANDYFGNNCFIDSLNNRIIVGARNKNTGRGAAYIFDRNSSTGRWEEIAKLLPSDPGTNNLFGVSVSVAGDYAVVGAFYDNKDAGGTPTGLNQPGSAYIYERNTSNQWSQKIKLISPERTANDRYGNQVRAQGNEIFIAAYNEELDTNGANSKSNGGAIYIYQRSLAGSWILKQKLVASDRASGDQFGINMEVREDKLIVGAFLKGSDDRGGAYIFEKQTDGYWKEKHKLISNDIAGGDNFGRHADIGKNIAIVGAPDDDEDANGANPVTNCGSAYIFEYNTNTSQWIQKAKIVAAVRTANDEYGVNTAIRGDHVLVVDYNSGSTDTGACYYYNKDNSGNWGYRQTVLPNDLAAGDLFGAWLSMTGKYAVVGSVLQDKDSAGNNTLSDAGAVYIFELTGTNCNIKRTDTVNICYGDSLFLQKKYQTSSGVYYDTLPDILGCDTILTTMLTILPIDTVSINKSICTGDSIYLQKQYRNTTGIYYDTVPSTIGCDSIIITHLTISNNKTVTTDTIVCSGDSILINSRYIKNQGTYYDTISNGGSCSIIDVTNVSTVTQKFFVTNILLCGTDSTYFGNKYLKTSGIYYDTVYDNNCPDTVRQLNLVSKQFPVTLLEFRLCPGDSIFYNGIIYKTDTTFYDTIQKPSVCDSIVVTRIRNVGTPPQLKDTIFYCDDKLATMDAGDYKAYSWSDGSGSRIFQTNVEGFYFVEVTDTNNCKFNDSFLVWERCDPLIFVPNAFSPNNDGKNDFFFITTYNIIGLNFMIFDRWGEILFETNATSFAWDGKYKDTPLPIGVYHWLATFTGIDRDGRIKKSNQTGMISLIR